MKARRIERWAFTTFRASAHALAGYRIFFAAYLLVRCFPQGRGVHQLPHAFFDPPLGVPSLFAGFVGESTLIFANALAAASLLALLLGVRTQLASYASTASMVLLHALVAAAGKIDHAILIVVCPAILASSGWGEVWSVDALRAGPLPRRATAPRGRWQLAWLALVITMAMSTAGIAKLGSGWLDPRIAASYGHGVANRWLIERHTLLGALLLRPAFAPAWELLDWATVLFELLAPLAIARAAWMRAYCVVACAFHLGVGLTMDIWFAPNVVVYAAFVPWERLLPRASPTRPGLLFGLGAGALLVLGLASLGWNDEPTVFAVRDSVSRAVVLAALPFVLYVSLRGRRAPTQHAAMRVA